MQRNVYAKLLLFVARSSDFTLLLNTKKSSPTMVSKEFNSARWKYMQTNFIFQRGAHMARQGPFLMCMLKTADNTWHFLPF